MEKEALAKLLELEEDELVLWSGKPAPFKILDKYHCYYNCGFDIHDGAYPQRKRRRDEYYGFGGHMLHSPGGNSIRSFSIQQLWKKVSIFSYE